AIGKSCSSAFLTLLEEPKPIKSFCSVATAILSNISSLDDIITGSFSIKRLKNSYAALSSVNSSSSPYFSSYASSISSALLSIETKCSVNNKSALASCINTLPFHSGSVKSHQLSSGGSSW